MAADTLEAMTHLYFVRHAESEMNTMPHLIGGRSNHVHLTEKGIRQAKAFGKWLKASDLTPDAIFVSPAERTLETMNYSLAEADMQFDATVDPRIQELGQGVKEGVHRHETYSKNVMQQIAEQTFHFKFDEGESIAEVMERMQSFSQDVARQYPNGTVLVYSHGFSTLCLAAAIKKLSHAEIVGGTRPDNVSLTHIEITPEKSVVHFVGKSVIDSDSV